MRLPLSGLPLLCLLTVACTQAPSLPPASSAPQSPPAAVRIPAASEQAAAPPVPQTSSSPQQALQVTRTTLSGIEFEGVAFDSGRHRLAIVDQPSGPGSRFPDARAAASSRSGLAGFNAGFFTPEGAPLGKVVSSGTSAGSWNGSSLGSGVFLENTSGRMILTRRSGVPASGQRELLQAGPWLVEHGNAVSGLDSSKPAVRTFIAWDGGNRWWIGRSSSCTLSQLSSALSRSSPTSWPIRSALNLDGGRSTDLWISGSVPGGPASFRPIWNRPVRNFLVLIPR